MVDYAVGDSDNDDCDDGWLGFVSVESEFVSNLDDEGAFDGDGHDGGEYEEEHNALQDDKGPN